MAYSGNGGSEYAQNYRPWPLPQRIHARALPEAKKPEAPFVDVTTHKADYAPKKIQPRIRPIIAGAAAAAEGAGPKPPPPPPSSSHYGDDCVSEYALRYQAKPIQPRIRPVRPDPNAASALLPFEGVSTQKADFQKWPLKPRVHAKPPEARRELECPFTESSTYALSFWDKSKCMPAKVRVTPAPPSCTAPFEGESVMHSDYVSKPLTPKFRAPPPSAASKALHPAEPEADRAPRQFKGWELPPKTGLLNPGDCGAKFSGETTYSAEFKPRELPRRFPAPPRPHSSLS